MTASPLGQGEDAVLVVFGERAGEDGGDMPAAATTSRRQRRLLGQIFSDASIPVVATDPASNRGHPGRSSRPRPPLRGRPGAGHPG